jgi:hypothetical protein
MKHYFKSRRFMMSFKDSMNVVVVLLLGITLGTFNAVVFYLNLKADQVKVTKKQENKYVYSHDGVTLEVLDNQWAKVTNKSNYRIAGMKVRLNDILVNLGPCVKTLNDDVKPDFKWYQYPMELSYYNDDRGVVLYPHESAYVRLDGYFEKPKITKQIGEKFYLIVFDWET